MNARALTGLIRFVVVAMLDVHRYCRLYFAEEIDRAEQAKRNR